MAGPRHDAGGRPDDRRDLQPGADLLAFRWLLKPALTLLILAAAGTTYFMTQYGVLMDVGMLRNVMQTNPAEVADLLSPKLAVYLVLLRCAAGLAARRTPVRYRPWPTRAAEQSCWWRSPAGPARRGGAGQYQGLSSLFRNNKETAPAGHPEQPGRRRHRLRQGPGPRPPPAAAADRRRCPARRPRQGHARKSLPTVLVVGESARAQNRPQR
ncbi:DUF1705 domain-containing protein [Pseudomonas aeruginosa]|nr:DUF1705 domain-containing protein [Pseudomonas aeruginosa]